MRRLVALAAALVLAACQQDPPGTCGTHFQCNVGQQCSGGVCVALATDHQVGSRCVRDADCVAWAGCAAETCRLMAGRCTTGGDCGGWQVCDAGHTCVTGAGFCVGEADCAAWQDCGVDHRCALTPGMCGASADCATWQVCGAAHACATAPGYCAAEADCAAWQDCGADHRCAVTSGMCGTSSDCAGWETCGADNLCALAPNGCADATGCAAWQDCVGYRCATASGFCAVEADCAAWQDCGVDHVCALSPGMCGATSDCAAWETCVDHACGLTPGMCTSDAECPAWKSCSTANVCALRPGACDAHADCATWQSCGTDHACADVGATCTGAYDCEAWQDCVSGHCANAPGRCGTSPECDPAWQTCDVAHVCVAAPGHCATSATCAAWENCTAEHSCGPARPCGSATDCAAGETCAAGFCTADISGGDDDFVLFGTLHEGLAGWDAVAPLKSPTHASVGFHRPEQYPTTPTAWLDSSRNLIYVEFADEPGTTATYELRRFVPDPFDSVGWWDPPADDPHRNDPLIPTPPCADGPWPYWWIMQQGTDQILYRCSMPYSDWKYYDVEGNLRVSGYMLYAWRSDGWLLGSTGDFLYVIDPAGNATKLATPTLGLWDVMTARAYAEGFRFVIEEYPDRENQLWYVDLTGAATLQGVYPAPPPGVNRSDFALLDSTGAAYAVGSHSGSGTRPSNDVVIRCPVAPDVCTIVYDEADAPTEDLTVTPPHVWVYIHGASLVSRP